MQRKLFVNWLIFSVIGLLLLGAGLSVFGEAVILKSGGAGFGKWFAWGTVSLIIFNTGISFVGRAVGYRVRLDRLKEEKENG